MVWELLRLAACGLLVGALGRLAVPGPDPMPWPRTLLAGLAGALGGGLVTRVVLGQGRTAVCLLISAGLAGLLVAISSLYHRSRHLPPN
jgi:uncharacterized membrane protein YeaQ/YmgE (transglycosylase-associated protein family)